MEKSKINWFLNWFPTMAVAGASIYMGYNAWTIHVSIGMLNPGDDYTRLIFRTWNSLFQNYLNASAIFAVMAVAFSRITHQSIEAKKLSERVNWTVERLAAMPTMPPSQERSDSLWPWGHHHTEALGHLEAAAKRWWTLYEPSDPTTAPTNEMVSDWLRQERGVSREKATSIASILRADGLKTGPRH